jgi:glycosyltransferase involved in cell wall biosynthesis
MRIAIVSNWYPPYALGGAEILAHDEAVALRDRGHSVMSFAGDGRPGAVRYRLDFDRMDEIPVWRVGLEVRDFSFGHVNFHHAAVEKRFTRFLDAFQPEVVHFHNLSGLSLGLIGTAARRGIRTVMTLHDYWGFCFKNTLLYVDGSVCEDASRCASCRPSIQDDDGHEYPIRVRNDYIAFQFANVDVFLSPSNALGERYRATGTTGDRLRIVPNGVDTVRFSVLERKPVPGELRVTYAGYLGPHKGLDVLIDAVARIPRREALKVRLIGAGWQMQELNERIASAGLQQTMRISTGVPHKLMEDVYRETDVLVLPSIWPENQPCTIMEAMACGLPVIASDLGGIRELITHGRQGFLFGLGDSGELARLIELFQAQPELAEQMGAAARVRAEQYRFDFYIDALERFFAPVNRVREDRQPRVIACLGKRFPENFHTVMKAIKPALFVMDQWLTDAERREADACWVLDASADVVSYMPWLEAGVPLLLPERVPLFLPPPVASTCRAWQNAHDVSSILSAI